MPVYHLTESGLADGQYYLDVTGYLIVPCVFLCVLLSTLRLRSWMGRPYENVAIETAGSSVKRWDFLTVHDDQDDASWDDANRIPACDSPPPEFSSPLPKILYTCLKEERCATKVISVVFVMISAGIVMGFLWYGEYPAHTSYTLGFINTVI